MLEAADFALNAQPSRLADAEQLLMAAMEAEPSTDNPAREGLQFVREQMRNGNNHNTAQAGTSGKSADKEAETETETEADTEADTDLLDLDAELGLDYAANDDETINVDDTETLDFAFDANGKADNAADKDSEAEAEGEAAEPDFSTLFDFDDRDEL